MAQFQSTFHNGGYAVRVVYTVNSQSAANNTSNVTVEAHLVSLKSSYNIRASATKHGSLVINGTTYNFTFNATISSLQDKKVYTTTVTIPHNSDGTKSFSISCTLGIDVTLSGTKYTKVSTSDTITLTTIPRTTPVSTSGTAKFGATITITHTRASTAFSITLRYACGSASGTIITKQATNSTSWTVPKSLQSQIPKSTSIPITIYCDTYSGNTLIGTTSTSYTCSIADDCNPSLTSLVCKNPDTGGSTYYQGVSKLRVEVGYSQAYGSPITKFVMVVDGQSITNYGYIIGTGVLRNSGAKDVKLTITDARGRTATRTWTSAITVTAYSAPKINRFTCKRMGVDEDGNTVISNLGSKGYFSYSISWHSSSTNKVRKFYYKPNASSSWTTVSLSSDSYTDYNFNNSLASGSGYDLKLEISDQVTTVSQIIQMPYLFPLINLSADGTAIAFGKECNASNKFMVSMDASFNKKTQLWEMEVGDTAIFNSWVNFNDSLLVNKGDIQLKSNGFMFTNKISCVGSGWVDESNIETWGFCSACHILPSTTNRYVGSTAHRWQQLCCVAPPNISSDARNKENVKYMYDEPDVISEFTDVKENDEITTRDLLDFVLNDLHMVTFDYKQSTEGMEQGEIDMVTAMNNRQIGFIAQDVENTKVGKYLVTKDNEGIFGYESSNWPSIIAGALQQEIRDRQAADKELMDMLNNIINM